VDRLPTDDEWSLPNLQLWAVGYNGNLYDTFDASKVLWAVTNGIPSRTGFDVGKAVWISYLRLPDPSNPSYQGAGNNPFFVQFGFVSLPRDDFAGGPCVNCQLQIVYPGAGRTTGFPDCNVGPQDLFYFATAYGMSCSLVPYADMNADGTIGPQDTFTFIANY
jgi:hypothetical protein